MQKIFFNRFFVQKIFKQTFCWFCVFEALYVMNIRYYFFLVTSSNENPLLQVIKIAVLGTASFFLSPQSANPQSIFNFLSPQPQVRNCTFKSLVRNRKSVMTFQDSWIRNRKSPTS